MTGQCGRAQKAGAATIASLRRELARFFPGVDLDSYFRLQREDYVRPSTAITVRQAASVLIALLVQQSDTATEVARIGAFRLRYRSKWLPAKGAPFNYYVDLAERPDFLTFLEQAIEAERGALPGALGDGLSFGIAATGDEAAIHIPQSRGGGMLWFSADQPSELALNAERAIGSAVIKAAAACFGPRDQEATSPDLQQALLATLGLPPIERVSA